VFRPVPACADPDLQPAAGQYIEAGQILRQHRRVPQVDVEHECPDP